MEVRRKEPVIAVYTREAQHKEPELAASYPAIADKDIFQRSRQACCPDLAPRNKYLPQTESRPAHARLPLSGRVGRIQHSTWVISTLPG